MIKLSSNAEVTFPLTARHELLNRPLQGVPAVRTKDREAVSELMTNLTRR